MEKGFCYKTSDESEEVARLEKVEKTDRVLSALVFVVIFTILVVLCYVTFYRGSGKGQSTAKMRMTDVTETEEQQEGGKEEDNSAHSEPLFPVKLTETQMGEGLDDCDNAARDICIGCGIDGEANDEEENTYEDINYS